MRLTITRHGETEENVKMIAQGHLPGKLTKSGKEQAKKLAKRLKGERFDIIFSSDLARAVDTAKEVAKFHPRTPLKFTKELRERFLGDLQGKIAPPDWKSKKWNLRASRELNAETPKEMSIRAKKILDILKKEYFGKNVLLVTHGGISQQLIRNILKKPMKDIEDLKMGNTAITIFEFDENKNPLLKLLGDTKHLE